jgi:hypothetical protein
LLKNDLENARGKKASELFRHNEVTFYPRRTKVWAYSGASWNCRRILLYCATWLAFTLVSQEAFSHDVNQQISTYRDNQGQARHGVALGLTVDSILQDVEQSLSLIINRQDIVYNADSDTRDEELDQIEDAHIQNRGANLRATHTFGSSTETRSMVAYSTDGKNRAQSFGLGFGRWLSGDLLRFAIDFSRTVDDRTTTETLDYDGETISPVTQGKTTGAILSLRHLASPTTIFDYNVGQIVTNDRPPANFGGIKVRQFIEPLNGAVHLAGNRSVNRGTISTQTNYGEVDSWLATLALLKNLWRGGLFKIEYRYYQETEITRAYKDLKWFGSDAVASSFSQSFAPGVITEKELLLTLKHAKYVTNTALDATMLEIGLSARF